MADIFSNEKRSEIMNKIKGKNSKPEMTVRKLVYSLGYRYRLHVKELPGTPDIVFTKRKKVIFINGCFWHGHTCKRAKLPETNLQRWSEKICGNKDRDNKNLQDLHELGWQYIVIWQCEIIKKNIGELKTRIIDFLDEN